ncbi:MAG: hypothetical protein KHZ90_08475 [Veillonella parvula]|uniref:Uncharacterized protein n=1 Tax=Veillonella parvula TaxID=29466 RepID=A0A942WNE1_VEIPA|nr:hypothetical protein [Veillonella parvula]MBS4893796.1 hypothetical protein [Veillonella parvula]
MTKKNNVYVIAIILFMLIGNIIIYKQKENLNLNISFDINIIIRDNVKRSGERRTMEENKLEEKECNLKEVYNNIDLNYIRLLIVILKYIKLTIKILSSICKNKKNK